MPKLDQQPNLLVAHYISFAYIIYGNVNLTTDLWGDHSLNSEHDLYYKLALEAEIKNA